MGEKIKKPLDYKWKGKTILVVEDTESTTKYFMAAFRKTEATLLWADNGKKALEIVEKVNDLDVILMDLHMPVMNGLEATKRINEMKPEIPIIVQTAYVLSGEEEKSMQAGADGFMSKPIKLLELMRTVDEYLYREPKDTVKS